MKKFMVLMLVVLIWLPTGPLMAADSGVIEMKLGHFAADSHPGNLAA